MTEEREYYGDLSIDDEDQLQPGDTLGPWRLTGRLASGGMGVVFAAERADELYEQKVAVKLLHGLPDPRTAERLAEERRILAGLQHPNIARLYDGGTTAAGLPYLVMEFVDGQPLDAHCGVRRLDLRQRLALFVRVCRAVQAAHAHLVVHCDLKPGNVLVRDDGEPVLLVASDFDPHDRKGLVIPIVIKRACAGATRLPPIRLAIAFNVRGNLDLKRSKLH